MTYVSKYLEPHELVDKETLDSVGGSAIRVSMLFDDRLLVTADKLRERYGVIHCNNWFWGGRFSQRGLRSPFSETGAKFSDHKFGRALDVHFNNITAQEVRQDILNDPFCDDFKYITVLEMTLNGKPISWLHFGTRNWDKKNNEIQQLHI